MTSRRFLTALVLSGLLAAPAVMLGPSAEQAPAPPPPALVRGTLSYGNKQPVPNRHLLFVGDSNRCPETCSCDDGTCKGGPECAGKFCVLGIITRTNAKGAFGIRLRPGTYDVYVDSIAETSVSQRGVTVAGEVNLNLSMPKALDRVAVR